MDEDIVFANRLVEIALEERNDSFGNQFHADIFVSAAQRIKKLVAARPPDPATLGATDDEAIAIWRVKNKGVGNG